MGSVKNIAVIADYLPRRCGIATFTADLCDSLMRFLPAGGRVEVIALDDRPEGYAYPECVTFQVNERIRDDYVRAAEFVNINDFDLAIIQHEYGIFGGQDGAYLLHLLRDLRLPIVTTLHTVLRAPNDGQRDVLMNLAELSDRLVVMSQRAIGILRESYGIPEEKIAFIPHGIHDVPFSDPIFHKDKFQVERNKVILTFGLIGPGKGLEFAIDAMPAVVQRHPDAVYLILGATHPHILRDAGESYRQALQQRARDLGVENHVIFHNRFVSTDVLIQYLSTADIYCTPYPNVAQITSGTLAYAMGAGKAVVSTPYWYAEEMLADGRGRLLPYGDVEALSQTLSGLLEDDFTRNAMRKAAYLHCRPMIWSAVAHRYQALGEQIVADHTRRPKLRTRRGQVDPLNELPMPDLRHLRALTDDTGLIQHAAFATPDRDSGYCVDDNARSLIAVCMEYRRTGDAGLLPLIRVYLAFLRHAYDTKTKRFHNCLSYQRAWLDDIGSEDAHGHGVWALGSAVKYLAVPDLRGLSTILFSQAIEACEGFRSPRSICFALVGMHAYMEVFGGDSQVRRIRNLLARRLFTQFQESMSPGWPWLEDTLTYSNGIFPFALMLAGQWIPEGEMHALGLQTIRWLLDIQTDPESGHLTLIGNEKWMTRDGERSKFDQQPIEIMSLILACCEGYRSTHDESWLHEARRCLDWFLGRNDLRVPMADFRTGGSYDGLQPEGVNLNEGAESTVAWLISLLAVHEISATKLAGDPKRDVAAVNGE